MSKVWKIVVYATMVVFTLAMVVCVYLLCAMQDAVLAWKHAR